MFYTTLDVKIRKSDGTVNDMTLTDVLYIEDLNCNVISVFSAREKGFKLGESSNGPTLSKGKFILEAYVKLNAGNSYLMGFDVGRFHRNFNLISYQELHNKLGHPGTKKLQNTDKDYNIKIDDFQVEKCESCALAKCRRTNLNKINTNKVEKPGERIYLYTSWTNLKSGGGSIYWFLLIDEVTQFSWSTFGKKKSDLSYKVFPIILGIFNNGYKVKKLRLYNSGENWDLENKCLNHLLGINFEYTTPNTPQFNSFV